MSDENLYSTVKKLYVDSVYVVYGLSGLGCIALFVMMWKRGWNRMLVFLLIFMLGYAVGMIVWAATWRVNLYVYVSGYTLSMMASAACHWTITETYLKTAHYAKVILGLKSAKDPKELLSKAESFTRRLKFARYAVVTLILVLGALLFIGYEEFFNFRGGELLFYYTDYSFGAFCICCMLVWAWTLYKLYNEVSQIKNLLPSKNFFRLHVSLLALYLVLEVAATISD